jgi:hypothetical protein
VTTTEKTCFEITCDGCDDGWEEGTPHFPTANEAHNHARDCGWLVIGQIARCPECATKTDCEVTGHRYDDHWFSGEVAGAPYRYRYCGHCSEPEHEPPWTALMVLAEAARAVDGDGAA